MCASALPLVEALPDVYPVREVLTVRFAEEPGLTFETVIIPVWSIAADPGELVRDQVNPAS